MKKIIVAQYKEDVSWVHQVSHEWEPWVITKDKDIPNVGREPSTFFWAMHQMYDSLQPDDVLAFVQGDPFPHFPMVVEFLLMSQDIDGYISLGIQIETSDPVGAPHNTGPNHYNLPVAEKLKQWFDKDWGDNIIFTAGGQFIVTGKDILHYPKEFYTMLYDEMCSDPNIPYVMERLWPVMFGLK